jgi:hypothetical protein
MVITAWGKPGACSDAARGAAEEGEQRRPPSAVVADHPSILPGSDPFQDFQPVREGLFTPAQGLVNIRLYAEQFRVFGLGQKSQMRVRKLFFEIAGVRGGLQGIPERAKTNPQNLISGFGMYRAH